MIKSLVLVTSIFFNILAINPLLAEPIANNEKIESMSIALTSKNFKLMHSNNEPVIYQGEVSYDDAGTGEGAMLYPAPNAGGFVAALITHGLLTKSAREKQKKEIQIAANAVLADYAGIITGFSNKELMNRAIEKLSLVFNKESNDEPFPYQDNLVINIEPSFLVTQDEKAIIINDSLEVKFEGTSKVIYKNTITVVSNNIDSSESTNFWTDNSGENLKNLSAELLAESIALTLKDMSNSASENIPFKTVRYQQGGLEKIERAKIIQDNCERMVIKNLRGILMSVPALYTESCTINAT